MTINELYKLYLLLTEEGGNQNLLALEAISALTDAGFPVEKWAQSRQLGKYVGVLSTCYTGYRHHSFSPRDIYDFAWCWHEVAFKEGVGEHPDNIQDLTEVFEMCENVS